MDFQELLSHADYNASEAKYQGSSKKYSSVLPPPKKVPKANVQSENIKRFLEKKKAEEEARAAQAQREKERLLALRAQNTKSNKKAKIMASRTKDNDFSKIKLTDDELEAKKRREAELLRKNLCDKVERMKARIEMEEKEKMLPKKRKRKSKNGEAVENHDDNDYTHLISDDDLNSYTRSSDSNHVQKNKVHKPKPPPPPNMSFMDLLKIAEKRQVDPVEIPIKKKEEEKLLTKKEKKLMEEEKARLRRKQERMLLQNGSSNTSSTGPQTADKGGNAKPVVIHVGKDAKTDPSGKFKIPKSTSNSTNQNKVPVKNVNPSVNAKSSANTSSKSSLNTSISSKSSLNTSISSKSSLNTSISSKSSVHSNVNSKSSLNTNILSKSSVNTNSSSKDVNSNSKSCSNLSLSEKPPKSSSINGQKKVKPRDETVVAKDIELKKKNSLLKKNGMNSNSVHSEKSKVAVSAPVVDEEALKAKIEKQLREKMEKEIEERIAAKFAQFQNSQPKVNQEVSDRPKQVRKETETVSNNSKKVIEKPSGLFKKDMLRMIEERKKAMEKSSLKPKLPEKKPFHKNPYLDPPRRLLEPQRPPRPLMKRRIESDDDDDDDDDDMSDFIDDGPSQNEEDYSKYIKEIFGYDRNKYLDIDDEDIQESSYAEQMKEEIKSAKLGFLEDLEEERKLKEMEKKKKMKKLKK